MDQWGADSGGVGSVRVGYVSPCADCAFLTNGSYRLIRGGSFLDFMSVMPVQESIVYRDPTFGVSSTGVRCARSP